MKRRNLILVGLIAGLVIAFLWFRYRPVPEQITASLEPPAIRLDVRDVADALPRDTLHPLYRKTGFTLAYDEQYEQAAWVSYILTRHMVESGTEERTDRFRADTLILTGSATPADYLRSGYDRGHLAPAADMKWSAVAMDESFLMSNMSPQLPAFNRGSWRRLEEQVRDWAVKEGRIYVVTGPVLNGIDRYIGANRVGVPRYYFKAILDLSPPDYKAIAFLMPNDRAGDDLMSYAITVDSLESVLGLDLFAGQDPASLNWLESRLDVKAW